MTRRELAQSWRGWFMSEYAPPGPAWLQWLWTGVFCLLIALGFTVLGMAINAIDGGSWWSQPARWARYYGQNLVVSTIIGYIIHVLFIVTAAALGRSRIHGFTNLQRGLYFTAVPITGVMIGWPLGLAVLRRSFDAWSKPLELGSVVGVFLWALLISFILYQIFSARAHQMLAEKRATEAQLRLLQAQMEPHFLFNTLANVLTLIEAEPARARAMLEAFTDYLRSSLTSLRRGDSTLGRELELARTYLALIALRMEDRLRVEVEVDPALETTPVAPLLLQPLVENAVQHGLEPKVEGGTLRIAARADGERLVLTVRDDGVGLDAPPRPGQRRNGVALGNLRERLLAMHGTQATLTLEAAGPGTCATLTLPLAPQPR